MATFKLCPDDKLVHTLQSVFKANIVRIPEARIQPLCAIAMTNTSPSFWGYLNELIEDKIMQTELKIEESRMADISGKKSQTVNLELGLQILEGFLNGFSLPSSSVSFAFQGAKTVSFGFKEVMRYYISPALMGKIIQGHTLDINHPSNKIFFNKEAQLLIIDSIITSKDFSINVETAKQTDFTLNIPAIEKIVGEVQSNVKLSSTTGMDITFKGDIPLTFAFTCLNCDLDEAGRVTLKPSSISSNFKAYDTVEHELLSDEPCMIDL